MLKIFFICVFLVNRSLNKAAAIAYFEQKAANAKAAEEEKTKAEAEEAAKNSTEGLLKQILAELKKAENK